MLLRSRVGGLRGRAFAAAGAGRSERSSVGPRRGRWKQLSVRRPPVRYVFSSSPTSLASWQIYWTEEITFFTPREGGRGREEK